MSVASDGRDNTDYAGALCDIMTKEKARKFGLDVDQHLEGNESYKFFEYVGDYLMTGSTGSNVSDLVIGIKL
jgi:glycerate-2-kinase